MRAWVGAWRGAPVRRTSGRVAGLVVLVALTVLLCLVSLAVGAKAVPLEHAIGALTAYDPALADHVIVRESRVPRTLAALLVGAALGLAGTVTQGLTRNPLADPGLLGVSAGASLAVVLGLHVVGFQDPLGYVWFSLAGAAVTSVFVFLLGSSGPGGASPMRLALAGAATTALLGSLTAAVLLLDSASLDRYRFWAVGAVAGVRLSTLADLLPLLAVGAVLAAGSGPLLNSLALGDDLAQGLGVQLGRSRALCATAVVLLVGTATAIAGPIAFVGLTVPHVARALVGADHRWVLAYSAVLAAVLLIGSDVLGRMVARPGEVQVGVVTAVVGAPFFIALVRRRRLASA
ncbi:iron chelate uptake ABC transporter family permease subunit [Quadrisphaera granulorum]